MREYEAMNILLNFDKQVRVKADGAYQTSEGNQACSIGIDALKKQIPIKIDRVGNKCPVCKCYLASQPIPDSYCFSCGQAIDWSVEE